MWGFAVRNRPLDQTNVSIVKNDVRMVWEVDAISAKTNSTTRIRGRTLRAEFNSKDVRHRAQKWNVGKSFTVRRIWNKRKGTWNVLQTFRETHAISAMASSTTWYEKERSETNHTNSSLAFPAHLHYHRTNKKKEFSICTKIAFAAIINVFIPG